MVTLRQIREAATEDLSLGLFNIRASMTDGDTIQSVSLKDALGDTDNRFLEGSYIYFKVKKATTPTGTLTLGAAISSATATSITLSLGILTDGELKVGDYIRVGTEDMLVTELSPTTHTTPYLFTATVVRGVLGSTAATHSNGAAVSVLTYGQWRSISSHSMSTNAIELSRTSHHSAGDSTVFDVYHILTPKELNECIGRALQKLWYRDRVSIDLDTDDNEYVITTSASWFTDPSQLIDMVYRYSSGSLVKERAVVNRKIISEDDAVSVILYDIKDTDESLVIQGRRWYDSLSSDDESTTCPMPLIRSCAKVEILEKIFNKLGKAAKDNYGMELAIAEKELEKMRGRYRQAITHVNFVQEEQFRPVDVPVNDAEWSNWT